MSAFVSALNESAVTFVPDVRAYGWHVIADVPTPGFEAMSPYGELKCFDTYADANAWRVRECRDYARKWLA